MSYILYCERLTLAIGNTTEINPQSNKTKKNQKHIHPQILWIEGDINFKVYKEK